MSSLQANHQTKNLIIPHFAEYDIALNQEEHLGEIDDVYGKMTIEHTKASHKESVSQKLNFKRKIELNIRYKDGSFEKLLCTLFVQESLDGRNAKYSLTICSSNPLEESVKTGKILIKDSFVEFVCDGEIQTKYIIPNKHDPVLSIFARNLWISKALNGDPFFKTQRVFTGEFNVPPLTTIIASEVFNYKGNYSKELLGERIVKIIITENNNNQDESEQPKLCEYYSNKGVAIKLEIPFDGLTLIATLKKVIMYDYSVL